MARYVYGVTRPEGDPPAPTVEGIEGAPVEILGVGPLQAVASPVSSTFLDLAEAPGDVVVAAVRRHDDVLRDVSRHRSLLPVRFGTVLADDAAVDDLLADRDGALHRALERVAGADEWVVAVGVAADEDVATPGDEDLSPGHAFFARRRSAEEGHRRSRARAVAEAEAIDEHLQAFAREFRALDLRDHGTVARGAYLVPHDVADRFVEAARTDGAAHVELQGPLPPYRFAETGT